MPEQTIKRNHMAIPWHDYIQQKQLPITQASLSEKASVIGRIGLMLLSCGTGAWRVRSSMNTISECLGVVCSADIGLMSVEYTCFDGTESFSQSLCLTNTGVNTSKLNRLERFVADFPKKGCRSPANSCTADWMTSNKFTACTPRSRWALPPRSRAAHLRFCSAAVCGKCSLPFSAQVSATRFAAS